MCKGAYTEATTKIAKENEDFVIGYICQEDLGDARFLHCTPGVKVCFFFLFLFFFFCFFFFYFFFIIIIV